MHPGCRHNRGSFKTRGTSCTTHTHVFNAVRFTRDREALVALGVLVNRPVARGPWNPRPRQRVEPVVNSRLQAELDAMKTENKRAWDGLADIKRDCDVLREEARRLREMCVSRRGVCMCVTPLCYRKEAAEKKKLVAETGQTGQKAEDKAPQVADKPKSLCSVCMAIPIDCTLVACGHTFCQVRPTPSCPAFTKHDLQTCAARVSSCPVCRTPIPWNGRIQLRLTFVE